eukprot:gene2878-3329_t
MLKRIQLHMIEKAIFAHPLLAYRVRAIDIPPIIAPEQRKFEMNPEAEKQSVYLKDDTHKKGHGFTRTPGHTGGFYHFVCRHDVTVASKFLILTESVRDAADIYLSLKHQPITFVCDTACTFVWHVNNHVPSVTQHLWGQYDGSFEVPDPKKPAATNKTFYKRTTKHEENDEGPALLFAECVLSIKGYLVDDQQEGQDKRIKSHWVFSYTGISHELALVTNTEKRLVFSGKNKQNVGLFPSCLSDDKMKRNVEWKNDTVLKTALEGYSRENFKRTEMLSFLEKDFPQYAWSLRSLDRRLGEFKINRVDKDVSFDNFIKLYEPQILQRFPDFRAAAIVADTRRREQRYLSLVYNWMQVR